MKKKFVFEITVVADAYSGNGYLPEHIMASELLDSMFIRATTACLRSRMDIEKKYQRDDSSLVDRVLSSIEKEIQAIDSMSSTRRFVRAEDAE